MSQAAGLAKYQAFIKEKKDKGMSHKEALEAWRTMNPKKAPVKKPGCCGKGCKCHSDVQPKADMAGSASESSEEVQHPVKPKKKVIKYYH
jgi:hypothetical protein